jgi:hypothetical protein
MKKVSRVSKVPRVSRVRQFVFPFLVHLVLLILLILPFNAIVLRHPSVAVAEDPVSKSSQGLGCGGGFGPIAEFLCNLQGGPTNIQTNKEKVGNKFNAVLGAIIGVLTLLAGLWFLFQFIIGGLNYLSAGGDKHAVEAAQQRLQNAIVGLVIVIIATVVVGLFGTILGLDILNPGKWISTLGL